MCIRDRAKPFLEPPSPYARAGEAPNSENSSAPLETWLIEPLSAPDFSLPDLAGKAVTLASFRGGALLLHFWAVSSPASLDQLRLLQKSAPTLASSGLRTVGVNVDEPGDAQSARSFAAQEKLVFPVVFASQDVAGIYNIIYRYLFDRRRDLPVPSTFLVDPNGLIVKVYQGVVQPERAVADSKSLPTTTADRLKKALPFAGALFEGEFKRNDFTYGVAFFPVSYTHLP